MKNTILFIVILFLNSTLFAQTNDAIKDTRVLSNKQIKQSKKFEYANSYQKTFAIKLQPYGLIYSNLLYNTIEVEVPLKKRIALVGGFGYLQDKFNYEDLDENISLEYYSYNYQTQKKIIFGLKYYFQNYNFSKFYIQPTLKYYHCFKDYRTSLPNDGAEIGKVKADQFLFSSRVGYLFSINNRILIDFGFGPSYGYSIKQNLFNSVKITDNFQFSEIENFGISTYNKGEIINENTAKKNHVLTIDSYLSIGWYFGKNKNK